jgi:hypothetical protein
MAEADPPKEPSSSDEQGHVLRSRLLDAFARFERSIMSAGEITGAKFSPRGPFLSKLDAFQKSCGQLSNAAKIEKLLVRARELNELRCDVVHSEMCVARHNDKQVYWIFANVSDRGNPRALSATNFKKVSSQLNSLAKELDDQMKSKGLTKSTPKP